MRLYVCWGKFPIPGHGHPCNRAYKALHKAGYQPTLIRSYGGVQLPELLNKSSGRQEAKRLTGSFMVPVLVTDDGQVVQESDAIVAWAHENPAPGVRPIDASTFAPISKF